MRRLIEDPTLEVEFSHRSWVRGRRYFEEGRVHDLRPADGGAVLEGWVQGTRSQPYRVWLSVVREEGEAFFDGACTCPAEPPCKHLAALLHAARADPSVDIVDDETEEADEDDETETLTRWLEALQEREQAAAPKAISAGRPKRTSKSNVLGFVVSRGSDMSGAVSYVTIEPRVGKLRKNGSLGSSKPYFLWQGHVRRGPSIALSDAERLLLFRLEQTELGAPHGRREGALPTTPEATALFEELLATERCFYGPGGNVPMRPGDRRAASVRWVLGHGGLQRLAVFATGDDADEAVEVQTVLPLDPPHYVDSDGATGPVDSSLPATTIAALPTMPLLDPADVLALPDPVREALLARGLPPPIEPPLRTVAATDRRPVMHISAGGHRDDDDPFGKTFATVAFDYGGVFVEAGVGEDVERHVEEHEIVEIHRDLGAEVRALWRLTDFGLEVEGDDHGKVAYATTPEAWLAFCQEPVDTLRAEGWEITIDRALPLAVPDDWYLDAREDSEGWFDLELGVEIDGESIDLVPLVVSAIRSGRIDYDRLVVGQALVTFELPDGRRIALPAERLAKILDVLVELYDERLADGPLRLHQSDVGRLMAIENVQWRGDDRLRRLAEQLSRAKALPVVKPPKTLKGELREYQARGLDWLAFLRKHGFGGVLADDMGLGKTIQTLAHLLVEKRARRLDRPCLVVAPRTVVGNWARECARFAPSLRCAVYHGGGRAQLWEQRLPDVVVTTYALLRLDEALRRQLWHVVVLDEAQAIKNPRSKVATIARSLDARQRLCLTGTPMENNLEELWSLMTFACPGLLGSRDDFAASYRRPIERYGDLARLSALSARIAPFMLRRTKGQVLSELPPKTEVLVGIPLERKQRDLYESVRMTMEKRVRKALHQRGLAKSQIVVLDALLKLRQVCCDPSLVPTDTAKRTQAGSAKLERLMELVEELHGEGRRTLIFSQFTSMLAIVSRALDERGIEHRQITGKTRSRQPIVDAFQAGEFPVLLVSLKAGGTGINLTRADVVIHYDPWWNPAVEAQATDRAHRIGQTRPVTVYRLVCEGSVEERMLALQDRKRALTETLQQDAERRGQEGFSLGADDVERLLAPLAGAPGP